MLPLLAGRWNSKVARYRRHWFSEDGCLLSSCYSLIFIYLPFIMSSYSLVVVKALCNVHSGVTLILPTLLSFCYQFASLGSSGPALAL